MRRQLLDLQANRIEEVLSEHHLPTRVWGGTVTPRFVRFCLSPQMGVRVSRIKALSEELALALDARSCRVSRRAGALHVEVPRENPATVELLALCRRIHSMPPLCAVLGVDEEGIPTLIRLPSPDVAHVLIAGTTGSGKTELARTMIASLALHNHLGQLQMILIDPKGRGFSPLAGLPHLLCPVVREAEEARVRLRWLLHEMERRDREMISAPRIVVFIDELTDLMLTEGKQVERTLIRLAQRGRQAGIHLIACTQKPVAAVIGSLVKSNFPVRVVGSVTSPEDAKVASGLAGTGAETLCGRGDFILVSKGKTIRLQGAYVSEEEMDEVVRRLRSRLRTDGNRGSGESEAVPSASVGWFRRGLQLVTR
jgi:S-DNA-T family DNA segregation ATPase FtsK/SpoIIIE